MKIVHFSYHLDISYGGLTHSVPNLCAALVCRPEISDKLYAFTAADEMVFDEHAVRLNVGTIPIRAPRGYADIAAFRAACRREAGASIVHVHGIWAQHSASCALAARQAKIPYVVSCHGSLAPWALRQKPLRKRLYWHAVEKYTFSRAALVHALTDAEAIDIREAGVSRPICTIPSAVSVATAVGPELFWAAHPETRGRKIILFMGRIVKNKGLDVAVAALNDIARRFPEAILVAAGPVLDDTIMRISDQLCFLQRCGAVAIVGTVSGQMKQSLLAASHCFVLPSESEGMSYALLEALSAGLPCVVTQGCNMPYVESAGAGFVCSRTTESIRDGLLSILSASAASHLTMSECASTVAKKRFSPEVIGGMWERTYKWMLGGERPPWVEG